jgi:D-alanyl-D-alanine carboxypeptidase-like protein
VNAGVNQDVNAGVSARLRRTVVIGAAAVAGVLAGALLMARVQDGEPGPSAAPQTESPGTVPAPDSTPGVLLAWTPDGLDPALEAQIRHRPGIAGTSLVRASPVDLVGSRTSDGAVADRVRPGWAIPLDAVALDPPQHAPFTPTGDRAAVARLQPGQALLGRTSAALRGVGPGGAIELAGGTTLTVAGVVDDTAIGGAELAVTVATGEQIGVRTPRYLLLSHTGDRTAAEQAVQSALPPHTPVRFRAPGETPFLRHGDAVLTQAQVKDRFGEFSYRRRPTGRDFEQDPAWQAENLVSRELPIIGRARCHRAVVDAIAGALDELEETGLSALVTPESFAGCWNPRLVAPGGAVSHHAWGIALDLGYRSNPTGAESIQDPRLVEVFARWGFTSGAQWLVPDAAHFEFVQPPDR